MIKIRFRHLSRWHLAAVLFALSLILRLMFLNAGLFHADSVNLAIAVERSVDAFRLYPTVAGRHLLVLINAIPFFFAHYLFGLSSSEIVINVTEAVFGALSVVWLYLFAERLTGRRFLAIAAAAMYSVTPIFLSITTYAKGHGVVVSFLILSAWLLVEGLERGNRRLLIASGVVFGLSPYLRQPSVLILPAFCLLYLLYGQGLREGLSLKNKRLDLRLLLPVFLPVFLLLSVYVWYFFASGGSDTGGCVMAGLWSPNVFTGAAWIIRSLGGFRGFMMCGVMMVLALLVYHRQNPGYLVVLGAWFMPTFIMHANLTCMDARFFVEALVPIVVLIAMGLDLLWDRYKPLGVVSLVMICTFMFAIIYPVISFRHEYSAPKALGALVANSTEPNARIAAVDKDFFIMYYGNRTPMGFPRLYENISAQSFEDIERYLDDGVPVYVINSSFIYAPDTYGRLVQLYDLELAGSVLMDDYHHVTTHLNLYDEGLYRISRKGKAG